MPITKYPVDLRPVQLDELYIPQVKASGNEEEAAGPHVLTISDAEVEENMMECLRNMVTKFPPKDEYTIQDMTGSQGLFFGRSMGIAYVLMNLGISHPDLRIESKLPREWTREYLSGTRPPITSIDPDYCGINSEELCLLALSAAHYHDLAYVHRLLNHVESLLSLPVDVVTNNGWHSGRAGQLYLLRLVRTWFPASSSLINPYFPRLISRILSDGPPWPFAGYDLIGPSHGRIGIATQILLSSSSSESISSNARLLAPVISQILDWQLPTTGNWPNTVPGSSAYYKEYLVQFCHGAAGLIIGLETIRPFLHELPDLQSRIDAALARARQLVWEKGLLRKEPNLCHGITGNAFVFPSNESRSTDNKGGGRRGHFLAHATEKRVREGLLLPEEREGEDGDGRGLFTKIKFFPLTSG